MTKAPSKVLAPRLPAGLAEKLDALAARPERSRGWAVKQTLAARVDREKERHRLTLEALADVDTGCVINHESVVAWAESLGTDKPLPPPMP